MASTILSDNGVSSGSAGLKSSADSTGVLALQTSTSGGAATTALTIDTSQNVGIGTTSPDSSNKLQVTGDIGLTWATDKFIGMKFGAGTSYKMGLVLKDTTRECKVWSQSSDSDDKITFYTGPTPSERMRIDSSGNATFKQAILLSYSANSNYSTDGALSNYSSTNGVYLNGNTAGWLRLASDGTQTSYIQITGTTYSASNQIQFITGGIQRAVIDSSGNLLVGTTTYNQSSSNKGTGIRYSDGLVTMTRSGDSLTLDLYHTGDGAILRFNNTSNTPVGNVNAGSSTTSYNTTSDYRLKENVAPMTGALATVAQLKPVTYKWKSTGANGQGFIAHELKEIVPDCVSGEKDAVDSEGNPEYQGIDTSFLVATLTAAIQEAKALIDTQAETINALTARIVALESRT